MNAHIAQRALRLVAVVSLGLGMVWLFVRVALAQADEPPAANVITPQSSGPPFLVKDINTFNLASSPRNLTVISGVVYFAADNGANGLELWKSDGTPTGTALVKDISIYTGSNPSWLTNVNGALFLVADDGVNGVELWKSDGTSGGTVMVRDILTGTFGSNPGALVNFNGALLFSASDGTNYGLWRSDGTLAGTVFITSVTPSYGPMVVISNTLYFSGGESSTGNELWKSDGTPTGTVLVKDIYTGTFGSYPSNLTNFNGTLFFQADNGVNGAELWESDGTLTGTLMVRDINTGTTFSGSSYPSNLTNVKGTLFFQAYNDANGTELWKSDGTFTNTIMVRDINTGTGSSYPYNLTNFNDTLVFAAYDPVNGYELWESDDTLTGTLMVRDINTGTTFSGNSYPSSLTNINGTLFFAAYNDANGYELWKTDGTFTNTIMVRDIYTGTTGSFSIFGSTNLPGLTNVNGILFFNANDGVSNFELWKSDGTPAGTVLVKDINTSTDGSSPTNLTAVGDTLFFTPNDPATGVELWKSDGTLTGTLLLKDIITGVVSSTPSSLVNVNGTVFFSTQHPTISYVYNLWKSDGTAAGTVLVKGPFLNPGSLTNVNVNGTVFFAADDGSGYGIELWKSDGTLTGTAMVKDINTGTFGSGPYSLTNINGTLFFTADDGVNGRELWKSDGTSTGTVLVKDIIVPTPANIAQYSSLTNVNGTLFFVVNSDGDLDEEIWKSDGTATGTVLVKDGFTGFTGFGPTSLTNVNGTLFFSANDGVNGYELWKSDGTLTGTVMIKDINSGASSGLGPYSSSNLTNVNGTLFFIAYDGVNGLELWKSDGTESGTVMVKDIFTGTVPIYGNPNSSSPSNLINVGGTLYFTANDGINGIELWKSDGTEVGTVTVADIYPGSLGSSPSGLAATSTTLFFQANDGTHGAELWALSVGSRVYLPLIMKNP